MYQPDAGEHLRAAGLAAEQTQRAAVRAREAGAAADEGGLAGPVGAQQRGDAARLSGLRQSVERPLLPEGEAELPGF